MASWFGGWRSGPAEPPAPAIHLRSASVDLDGNIIAAGSISYPPDPGGEFALQPHDQLRITRGTLLKISGCRAVREASSGFLISESFGPELWLPEEVSRFILVGFCISIGERRQMTLGHQAGAMGSAPEDRNRSAQHLSAWHVTLEQADGFVEVSISAALLQTVPSSPGKPLENYWEGVGDPARLTANFRVDAATRVACFGAYTGLEGKPTPQDFERVAAEYRAGRPYPPLPDADHTLSLESAPVGPLLEFASGGSRWITVSQSRGERPWLVLSPDRPGPCLSSGFLCHGNYGWPRLWFYGVNLDVIADSMGTAPSIGLALTGHTIGIVVLRIGPDGMFGERIVETHLQAEITVQGLSVSYRCQSLDRESQEPKWREGSLVLSWELLILRYPRFLKHRDKVMATSRD